jgi:hypothetical protein
MWVEIMDGHGGAMRWEELFEDLETQWQAQVRRELDAEVADRTRRERASITLADRLAAQDRSIVRVALVDGTMLSGKVQEVGQGWLVLSMVTGSCLVPVAAVAGISGLQRKAGMPGPGRSFGFGYALRGLSRDRVAVTVVDVSGGASTGTIDGVGRDFLELSEHPADLPRRRENITSTRVVPFAAIVLVRPASSR